MVSSKPRARASAGRTRSVAPVPGRHGVQPRISSDRSSLGGWRSPATIMTCRCPRPTAPGPSSDRAIRFPSFFSPDGWLMADAQWRMADGGWRMADGWWLMAGGWWRMADGGWRMADGGWRMADGGWRMADDRWAYAIRHQPSGISHRHHRSRVRITDPPRLIRATPGLPPSPSGRNLIGRRPRSSPNLPRASR